MESHTKLDPVTPQFFASFDPSKCLQCGECLSHCPIIPFSLKEAQETMTALIGGNPVPKLIKNCQSCFTCNFYCKKHLNPTNLIMQQWQKEYQAKGLRIRGRYFMTQFPNYPNFRTYGIDHMRPEERTILNQWASLEPLKGDTLTYPGCNVILTPTLVQSSLFADLDIRGRLEYCCGETLFRTGYTNELYQVTKRLDKWFNILHPKHLIVLCTAGTNVFRNVLPNYGLTYKFESVTSYIEWLWQRFEQNKIEVTHPLNLTVTIQESCYSKMFGDDYMDLPRKILNKIGCKVIEMPANRENMRCCGIAGGFSMDSAYHPFKIRAATCKNLDDARKMNVDAICVYCGGCYLTYQVAKKLYFKSFHKPIYHIIELIQMAIGETPYRLIEERSRWMFWGITCIQWESGITWLILAERSPAKG